MFPDCKGGRKEDSQHEIFLIKRLAVKELAKVDDGAERVERVEGVDAARLRVLLPDGVQLVSGPVVAVFEVGRVDHGQVSGIGGGRRDLESRVFSVLVGRVAVDDGVEARQIGGPIDLGVVLAFDKGSVQLHGVSSLTVGPGIARNTKSVPPLRMIF